MSFVAICGAIAGGIVYGWLAAWIAQPAGARGRTLSALGGGLLAAAACSWAVGGAALSVATLAGAAVGFGGHVAWRAELRAAKEGK